MNEDMYVKKEIDHEAFSEIKHFPLFFTDGSFFSYTRHEPVGVCGQIIPV